MILECCVWLSEHCFAVAKVFLVVLSAFLCVFKGVLGYCVQSKDKRAHTEVYDILVPRYCLMTRIPV